MIPAAPAPRLRLFDGAELVILYTQVFNSLDTLLEQAEAGDPDAAALRADILDALGLLVVGDA